MADNPPQPGSPQQAGKAAAIISVIVLCVLLIALAVGGAWLLVKAATSSPEVAAALVTGALTVIASVATVTFGKWSETASQIQKEHRDKKTPAYEALIEFLFKVLFAGKAGQKGPTDKQTLQVFVSFTREVMVWGSDDVIAAWAKFKTISAAGGEPLLAILAFEQVMFAIRKDLGHSNRGLAQGDILRLFINDFDSALAGKQAPSVPTVPEILEPDKSALEPTTESERKAERPGQQSRA